MNRPYRPRTGVDPVLRGRARRRALQAIYAWQISGGTTQQGALKIRHIDDRRRAHACNHVTLLKAGGRRGTADHGDEHGLDDAVKRIPRTAGIAVVGVRRVLAHVRAVMRDAAGRTWPQRIGRVQDHEPVARGIRIQRVRVRPAIEVDGLEEDRVGRVADVE